VVQYSVIVVSGQSSGPVSEWWSVEISRVVSGRVGSVDQ
jgi:hypothetical protein